MEIMVLGCVYATVDKFNDIKYITFHDVQRERVRQIDVKGTRITDMNMMNMEYILDCMEKKKSW